MKSLIEKAKEDPMCQILAVALRYYLKVSYKLIVLQKPQTSKKSKLKLLKKSKELLAILFEKWYLNILNIHNNPLDCFTFPQAIKG